MSTNHGAFCWYELMTPDLDAAARFYAGVFGWTVRDAIPGDSTYRVVSTPQGQIGGMLAITDAMRERGVPPCWTGYIAVDSVDTQTARIVAAGGALRHGPEDIPGVGRYAVVADPQGAVFIVFRDAGGQEPPAIAPGSTGHVGWHELHAGEGRAAFDFYAEQFGWQRGEAMDMGAHGVYQMFTRGAEALGGVMTKDASEPGPFWLYYVNVEAIDAAIARVGAGGGKVAMGPHEVPGGMWIAVATDPQGAWFAMVAPKR